MFNRWTCMLHRHLYLSVSLLLLCWLGVAHADQSKGPRGGGDSGQRGADGMARGDQDRSVQVRRDVLREAVKSQEEDAPVLLRQLSAEEKALLRQQLRQQRLEGSR